MTGLDATFAAHGVAVVYLFGSRAEGTAGEASDHDVAVLFALPPALDATARLGADLAAALTTPVDVVDLDRADPELRGRVTARNRRLFSADEVRRVRFEVDARILDAALADRMVALAGARNVIVHLYAEVDDELLARMVREGGLDDLDAVATRIAALAVEDPDRG